MFKPPDELEFIIQQGRKKKNVHELALKMTIKYYYQADFWSPTYRLLECRVEGWKKKRYEYQFMNFSTEKLTIGLHSGVTIWMEGPKPGGCER